VDDASWDVMGLCGTGSDTYSVSDLFVPSDYSVIPRATARDHNLPEGVVAQAEPERQESGILYRHSMQLVASCGLSSVAIGAAQAMLDAFIPLARKKTPSNAIALRDDGWVQARLAQADAKISSAKAWLVSLLHDAADILFQEAGATAIFRSNPFERRFRDVHTVSIQVQGSIARMQSAGQFYLGLTPAQLILVP
jgi:alkylation response protein AidB-like acyl-CoA dehydrogenase